MLPQKTSTPRIPKIILALNILIQRSANALEALSSHNEMNFHSTISTLCNEHGLEFDRVFEPYTHSGGWKTRFVRYTLKDTSRQRAIKLLNNYGIEVAS